MTEDKVEAVAKLVAFWNAGILTEPEYDEYWNEALDENIKVEYRKLAREIIELVGRSDTWKLHWQEGSRFFSKDCPDRTHALYHAAFLVANEPSAVLTKLITPDGSVELEGEGLKAAAKDWLLWTTTGNLD